MNVHITYKLDKSPSMEAYLQSQIQKLGPRLQVFNPDMVSLRGVFEAGPKKGYRVTLNLRLPSGTMVSGSDSVSLRAAIRMVFEDLGKQLRKHKDHLRSHYRFPGVRGEERPPIAPQVRFENTIAAVIPAEVSGGDINRFVNANLERLRRYVERELTFRRDSGQKRLEEVGVEEVVNEAIATALDEGQERPEKIALEPWLYRLSRSAMDRLGNQHEGVTVPERPAQTEMLPALDAGDEEMLQFFHPDELLTAESRIADSHSSSPEDEASREELMNMVERALRGAPLQLREAFLLFSLEGFRPAEIAQITERSVEDVQDDIRQAREYLRRFLTAAREKRHTVRRAPSQAQSKSA